MPETATQDLEEMVIVREPLDKAYEQLDSNTINTGTQISADRIKNRELRNKWFYTANLGLATKRNGKLYLGIGGRAAFNVVFEYDTEKACRELINTGYINLSPQQINAILKLERLGEVIFVDPRELQLQGNEAGYRSFPIRTARYDKDVTLARQPFVHAGFGSGVMLGNVMDSMRTDENYRISETGVYTMNPEHVAENVLDNGIVARASGLGGFDGDSRFVADGRVVDGANDGLRGVLKKAPKAPQKLEGALLEPASEQVVVYLSKPVTEEVANAALSAAAKFYTTR